jgi:hypothetical protein
LKQESLSPTSVAAKFIFSDLLGDRRAKTERFHVAKLSPQRISTAYSMEPQKKKKISTVQLNNLQNWVGDYYYYYRCFLAIAP